ncbi:thiolase domain-containing protein [Spongiactinospora sp. TRM90649]|uniref:thiolase domain-containing protein n=1 Tax=Spongiactinospora sp. TRM90649 TaxID=3031114 RepID=UPI0023F8C1F9|nr:thiolase domain-containing protein [Spongiactinospora sp. TRM90649]MDF5754323.1 thiolase domain-containing protein [Spongiactinospora sp. TRM90649]
MNTRGKPLIVGAYEHPGRELPDKSLAQIHAEVALGAVADAGLTLDDVDGFFCGHDAPGYGGGWISMADYLGLRNLTYMDSTESGGASPIYHVSHAAAAIAAGKCKVALVALAGKPRTGIQPGGGGPVPPEESFEGRMFGVTGLVSSYALSAKRHMYEYGTTSEQLAEIKVAATIHASHNPNAFLRKVLTVEDVIASPMIADPLRRGDCCVVTDGGGAVIVAAPEVARDLGRRSVKILGQGESGKLVNGGRIDLTYTAAVWSGPRAFEEAGVTQRDIDYVSVYDSFTITVLEILEDLGFCEKGQGGNFVSDGALVAPHGRLPFNTDGGGLSNNHPGHRGGITKIIEAVRQLRGEANPGVQLDDCELALVHGNGGDLGTRMRAATMILGREDA